jgi:hypothetical protein
MHDNFGRGKSRFRPGSWYLQQAASFVSMVFLLTAPTVWSRSAPPLK